MADDTQRDLRNQGRQKDGKMDGRAIKMARITQRYRITADNINGLKFADSSSSIGVEGTLT